MPKKKKKSHSKVKGKPEPKVLSINICDSVIRDEVTKKVSLIGLFNTIKANRLPYPHPLLHIHVALTNGHGKYVTDVRFVSLDDNKPLFGMKGDLLFQSPLQVVELIVCMQNLRFEKAGEYAVEVLCDNTEVGTRKFRVIGPEQTIPTDGTKG